ncbi:WW domain [Cinara cedri]|uniref:WW domain n=1 Tax=Cinara cedri TaxID=506608 RepID=A0A5E4M9R7_9HEMI|nr:WW domain [Cinara cedri]
MDISSEPVIRVFPDSEANLLALFDSVLNPNSKTPQQLPFRMRQLPNSFFIPPVTGSKSHSLKNSGDLVSGQTAVAVGGRKMTGVTGKKSILLHSRSSSSSASLQEPYTVETAKQRQARHARRRRYHKSRAINELGPLPQGWEQARTKEGLIYFLNHHTKKTQWEDPRKSLTTQTVNEHQRSAEQLLNPDNISKSNTCTITNEPTNSQQHMYLTLQGRNKTKAVGRLPDGCKQYLALDDKTRQFEKKPPVDLQKAPTSDAVLLSGLTLWLLNDEDGDSNLSKALLVTGKTLMFNSLKMEHIESNKNKEETISSGQTTNDLDSLPSAGHSQQESADSGSDFSNNYSLLNTPKDIMSANMENYMTSTSVENPGSSNISVDNSQEIDTLDDTDDLVPSLELEEGLSNEILDEVKLLINSDEQPESILTWL